MRRTLRSPGRLLRRAIATADRGFDALYHWSGNPIYQSGALTVAFLVLLLVTGTYLLFVYRIGSPYESVARVTADPWLGRWMRSLHRFTADAAVVDPAPAIVSYAWSFGDGTTETTTTATTSHTYDSADRLVDTGKSVDLAGWRE